MKSTAERFAVAVGSNGSRSLAGIHDLRPLPGPGSPTAVMMARTDVSVHVLELPAVAQADLAGFLAFQARSRYPGQPQETALDHRVLRSAGRRYAILFLVSRSVLEEYHRVSNGRPLFLPYFLLAPLLGRPRPGRVTVGLVWHASWIDALVLPASGLPRPALLLRAGSAAADFGRLEALLPPGTTAVDWRVVCLETELEEARAVLQAPRQWTDTLVLVPQEQALRRIARRPPSLFSPRARRFRVPRAARVALELAALAGLSFLLLARSVMRDEQDAARAQNAVVAMQARAVEAQAAQRDVERLQGELAALRAARPPDPGRVLQELAALLGADARVRSFSLESGRFQLEAVGTNALALMDRFRTAGFFRDVRLLQIVPQQGNARELFRITGGVQ